MAFHTFSIKQLAMQKPHPVLGNVFRELISTAPPQAIANLSGNTLGWDDWSGDWSEWSGDWSDWSGDWSEWSGDWSGDY